MYSTVPYVPCCTVPYRSVPYCTVFYCIVRYGIGTAQYRYGTVWCNTVQYGTIPVWYGTVRYAFTIICLGSSGVLPEKCIITIIGEHARNLEIKVVGGWDFLAIEQEKGKEC